MKTINSNQIGPGEIPAHQKGGGLKAEELIKLLQENPKAEVVVLSYKSQPVKIETAYYEKVSKRFIVEAD